MIFPKEPELIARLKKGDEHAVREWYTQSHSKLISFFKANLSIREDAEELVQDTFLSCLSALPLFRGHSGLFTFMMSVARHELADYWRKKYAKKAISVLPFGEELLHSLAGEHSVESIQIREILSRLPSEISEILQLKYVDGLSIKEIAQLFGVSAIAMQSRIYRAKEAFVAEYSKEEK